VVSEKEQSMAKPKIKDRIIAALREHGECGFLPYHALAEHVFPRKEYPRAWNYPTRGGPPGCYMVLSRAIREHGFSMKFGDAEAVVYTTVGLGQNRV
jgi:hypothetical protein